MKSLKIGKLTELTNYIAEWGVFVSGTDPVDAARNARKLLEDERRDTWRITNMDTGDSYVVDGDLGQIHLPRSERETREVV